MNEYIIINKTALLKRIEELENLRKNSSSDNNEYYQGQINALKQIISQSTPLIPEIEKAFEAGRKLTVDGFEEEDFKDYEDYISNLKLNI